MNIDKNITAALDEPARFARYEGVLYYECELGPLYAVQESQLHEAFRADLDMDHAGTYPLDAVPDGARYFEIGESEQHDESLPEALLISQLGAIDEAIEQWATWCDRRAAGEKPPTHPIRVPLRAVGSIAESSVA